MKPYQTAYQIAQQYDLPATTDTSTSKGTSTSGSSTVFKPLFQAPEKTISTIQSEPSTLTRSVLVSEPRLTINREPSTVSNLSVSQPAPSLTINREGEDKVFINLVPHTVNMTNLKMIAPGSLVNIEVDILARYAEKLLINRDSI